MFYCTSLLTKCTGFFREKCNTNRNEKRLGCGSFICSQTRPSSKQRIYAYRPSMVKGLTQSGRANELKAVIFRSLTFTKASKIDPYFRQTYFHRQCWLELYCNAMWPYRDSTTADATETLVAAHERPKVSFTVQAEYGLGSFGHFN